jgi:sulfur-carrier protein
MTRADATPRPTASQTMAATVTLSRALVDLFANAPTTLQLQAETVAGLIAELDRRFPGMGDRLVDERPAIRRHLNVFVDGQKAMLATPVAPGAQVYILTAMSGG